MSFEDAFAQTPIIAVLRGIAPSELAPVAEALCRAGITIAEIPLNSPEPLVSIAKLAEGFAGRLVLGAGTVRTLDEVDAVAAAGGQIIVSPHTATEVVGQTIRRDMIPIPGFSSPTEAFAAIDAGARYLKLFPAATYGPGHANALAAVLPREIQVIAVGGIGPEDMAAWWSAGVSGFGLGADIYRPGRGAEEVFGRARAAVKAFRDLPPRRRR
jgi:2-dehydro-3-deoxyphosphogalactonate aldolase